MSVIVKLFLFFGVVSLLSSIFLWRVKSYYFYPSTVEQLSVISHQEIVIYGLHARYYSKPSNDLIILFCHGNAGNLTTREDKVRALLDHGFNVLIFDYPGYGTSTGTPTEEGFYNAANVFTNYLIKQGERNQIIPYGESIGAAVAAYIVTKYQFPILILESPLPSMAKIAEHIFSPVRYIPMLFNEFNTEVILKDYHGKILLMHSPTDEIVPYHTINILNDLSEETIDMVGTHNNATIPWEEVKRFVIIHRH